MTQDEYERMIREGDILPPVQPGDEENRREVERLKRKLEQLRDEYRHVTRSPPMSRDEMIEVFRRRHEELKNAGR